MSGTTPGLATSNDLSAFNSWQIELFPSLTVAVLGLAWQTVHLSNIYPSSKKKKEKKGAEGGKRERENKKKIDQDEEGEYKW